MRDTALSEAITKAGGVNALARALGIASASVAEWRRVPPGRVPAVSRITGIPLHELRPDLFDAPPAALTPQTEAA